MKQGITFPGTEDPRRSNGCDRRDAGGWPVGSGRGAQVSPAHPPAAEAEAACAETTERLCGPCPVVFCEAD